jgi:hypothetical protein
MKNRIFVRIKSLIKTPRVFAPILAYLILLGPTIYIYSGSPPENEVEVYKGAWFSNVLPSAFAGMKNRGMNTVFIQGSPGGLTVALIQTAHRNGLKVALTMGIMQLDPNQAADLDLEALNSEIVELAKLAEKWGVEFFAPLNEADTVFEEDTGRWAQQILPRIKKVYHGEVIWKGADILDIDLSGYDYIGFTISPSRDSTLEEYSQFVDDMLDRALGFAERDNLKGVMITEFATFWWMRMEEIKPGYSEEYVARAHKIVLERGKGKAVGFFYFDEIPGVFGEWEEEISRCYKEMP